MVPAGMVNDSSVLAGVDLLPTFAAISGTTLPKDTPIDGEDVSDILKGSARQRKTTLYWEYRFPVAGDTINRSPQLAIREDNWKLLMNRDGSRVELYDLSKTHTEVDNLADQYAEVAKRLSKKLLAWKETLPPGEYQAGSGSDSYPWPK
jgi:arylsulfatase A-like enzyme